jgi:hypothetical protein
MSMPQQNDDANQKRPLAAINVAKRSAGQHDRSQQQRIRFNDPLHLRYRRAEVGLKRRQGKVDDG